MQMLPEMSLLPVLESYRGSPEQGWIRAAAAVGCLAREARSLSTERTHSMAASSPQFQVSPPA